MKTFEPGMDIAGGYRLVRKVGEGGFGEVWQAVDHQLDSAVALKFLRRLPTGASSDRLLVEEGQKVRRLTESGHRGAGHIVRVNRAVAATDDMPAFLDLQWMGGYGLDGRLPRNTPMPLEQIITILSQVVLGLECAHDRGIVHCDLKPSNILVDDEEKSYRLSDFGLARRVGELLGQSSGTPPYMSPEQFTHPDKVDQLSDIYSLGVIMFRMAEGFLPFKAQNWKEYQTQHCLEPVPTIRSPLVGEDFKHLIMDCLQKKAENRPTIRHIYDQLRIIGGVKVVSSSQAPPINYLRASVASNGDQRVRHVPTGVVFTPIAGSDLFVPSVALTHQHFYKFVNDAKYPSLSRWRPGSMSLLEQDGGYLEQWFMGKPPVALAARPVNCISHEAASVFASWMGGLLPTFAQLENLFFGVGEHSLALELRAYMATEGLSCLQFWCRDPVEGASDARSLWRLLPESSPLARYMARSVRPGHFCLPNCLCIVVLEEKVVRHVLDNMGGRDEVRPTMAHEHPELEIPTLRTGNTGELGLFEVDIE